MMIKLKTMTYFELPNEVLTELGLSTNDVFQCNIVDGKIILEPMSHASIMHDIPFFANPTRIL